jgi:hypothetical protein
VLRRRKTGEVEASEAEAGEAEAGEAEASEAEAAPEPTEAGVEALPTDAAPAE